MSSYSRINVCDPLRNQKKSVLLNAILTYLYSLRNFEDIDQRAQTIDEIIIGVQIQNPEFKAKEINNGVRQGSHQGLFSLVCTDEIPPLGMTFENRYEFNRNAPLVNTKNWSYLCPGARTMRPGICCSKPCPCVKGAFRGHRLGCLRAGGIPQPRNPVSIPGVPGVIQPPREKITIPGVPGSFTRVPPLNSCPIPIC